MESPRTVRPVPPLSTRPLDHPQPHQSLIDLHQVVSCRQEGEGPAPALVEEAYRGPPAQQAQAPGQESLVRSLLCCFLVGREDGVESELTVTLLVDLTIFDEITEALCAVFLRVLLIPASSGEGVVHRVLD